MRYRPDLDGIRALAVLAVIAEHSFIHRAAGGWMGVDVFFVLSGYLITTLLLAEKATGTIALGRFYARRALRLYPALLLALILGVAFYRDLGDHHTLAGYGRTALTSALYVQDLVSGLSGSHHGGLGHTWSLGVEEQFYIVWPLALVWLSRHGRSALPWALGGSVASWLLLATTYRVNGPLAVPPSYFLPWSRFSPILLGCAVAIILSRRAMPPLVSHWAVGIGLAIAATVLLLTTGSPRNPALTFTAPAIALVTASVILHLDGAQGGIRSVLGYRPLAYLGRRSYGIYLFHFPILNVLYAHPHGLDQHELFLADVVLAIALGIVSYRFVELPFLRLKHRRFEPPSHRPEPVPT